MSKGSVPATFNVKGLSQYGEAQRFFASGMEMSASNSCPYPMGSGDARTAWMSGFFDAYFQSMCDRLGLGAWGE